MLALKNLKKLNPRLASGVTWIFLKEGEGQGGITITDVRFACAGLYRCSFLYISGLVFMHLGPANRVSSRDVKLSVKYCIRFSSG